MSHVWVLSEESPTMDISESGGYVFGVFATVAAAILELGGQVIGAHRLAQIIWKKNHEGSYEGYGYENHLFFLTRHEVVEEEPLRQSLKERDEQEGNAADPFLTLTSAELAAVIEQYPEAMSAEQWYEHQQATRLAKYGL